MTERPVRLLTGRKVERSRRAIPARVPIALRTAIHGTVSQGRFDQPWSRRIVLFKWVIEGQAAIELDGHPVTFGPGQVAVHLPSEPHSFWVLSETAEMCWFSLDGPVSEAFVRHLGLLSGVYAHEPAPVERIERLMEALDDETPTGWRRASELAVAFLYELAVETTLPLPSGPVLRAQNLIEEEFADPELSVTRIAEELECHRATLSTAFRNETGTTVIAYITRVRLQEALLLLRDGTDSIETVARKCGFHDPVYFSRWCRKHTGLPPSQIRREQSIPELAQDRMPTVP